MSVGNAFAPGLVLGVLIASGCGGGEVVRRAEGVIDTASETVQSDRQERLRRSVEVQKTQRRQQSPEAIREALGAQVKDLTKLSLNDTLKVATAYNRDFATQRDQNLNSGLGLLSARHLFDPRLSSSISLLQNWARTGSTGGESAPVSASGNLGLDYATELGTRLHAGVATSTSHDFRSGVNANTSTVDVSINQPLLRGAGRTIAREPLTAAERSLIYQLRSFDNFRQSFTIDTISRYYNMVREKQVVDNNKENFERADFEYRRAKGLFKIGRVNELDVLQAEQQRLTAENTLRDAAETHKDSLLAFKTFLGVPDDVDVNIRTDEFPEFQKIKLDPDQAVQLALANRLDMATAQDQVDDALRGLKIAENALLPDLGLQVSAGTGASDKEFGHQSFNNHNASAGLTLTLPLDRLNEKIALKHAQISREQADRALAQFRDNLASDVRRRLRNLDRIEASMEVQRRIVVAAEKALARAAAFFRQGKKASRDVAEAQQQLLAARNTDVQYVVDHAIAELQLRQALGILTIQPDGQPSNADLEALGIKPETETVKPQAVTPSEEDEMEP
ncbi:MAG TPA: TolC family protein [Planctomycetota bacterium]